MNVVTVSVYSSGVTASESMVVTLNRDETCSLYLGFLTHSNTYMYMYKACSKLETNSGNGIYTYK